MLTEIVNTLILQSYAVEQTLGGLYHSGVVVALAGMEGGALDNDATDAVQRQEIGKFHSVAEGSGGCHNGVLKLQRTYIHT